MMGHMPDDGRVRRGGAKMKIRPQKRRQMQKFQMAVIADVPRPLGPNPWEVGPFLVVCFVPCQWSTRIPLF